MNIVDLDCEAVVDIVHDRFTIEEIQSMREGTEEEFPDSQLTPQCFSLIARLSEAKDTTSSIKAANEIFGI